MFLYLCYFPAVTLLSLRPHTSSSNITQFHFHPHSPTSNNHISLLALIIVFAGSSASKHTIRYQNFTICPRYFPLVFPLTRSIKPSLILHSPRCAGLRTWTFKWNDKFPQINTLYFHTETTEMHFISFFFKVCY